MLSSKNRTKKTKHKNQNTNKSQNSIFKILNELIDTLVKTYF